MDRNGIENNDMERNIRKRRPTVDNGKRRTLSGIKSDFTTSQSTSKEGAYVATNHSMTTGVRHVNVASRTNEVPRYFSFQTPTMLEDQTGKFIAFFFFVMVMFFLTRNNLLAFLWSPFRSEMKKASSGPYYHTIMFLFIVGSFSLIMSIAICSYGCYNSSKKQITLSGNRPVEIKKEKIDNNFVDKLFKNYDKIKHSSFKFQSCEFLNDSLLRLLNALVHHSKIELLEISDAKNINEWHALALAEFICTVNVAVLDVHGSNLEKFADTIFKQALIQAPQEFRTRIVFQTDEAKIVVGENGGHAVFGFSGCSIDIPKDALAEEIEITLKIIPELIKLPGNFIQVSPIIRCLPSGLKFTKPVSIRLSTWCRPLSEDVKLTVFTREDEKNDWNEECTTDFQSNKFIKFSTSHFSDDVVAARTTDDEVIHQYQIKFFQKLYAHDESYQKIYTFCFPRDGNFLNEVDTFCQSSQLYECDTYPITVRPNQVISTKIVANAPNNNPIKIEDAQKNFQCCPTNLNDCMHVSTVIYDVPNQDKVKGVEVEFVIAIDDVEYKKFPNKIIWKSPPMTAQLHMVVEIRNFIQNQNNLTNCLIPEFNSQ